MYGPGIFIAYLNTLRELLPIIALLGLYHDPQTSYFVTNVSASPPRGVQSTVMSMSVCLSVCLLVCLSAHIENYTAELHQYFSPLGKLANRDIYFACVNVLFFNLRTIISGCTGPIFLHFRSPNDSAPDLFFVSFAVVQGAMLW